MSNNEAVPSFTANQQMWTFHSDPDTRMTYYRITELSTENEAELFVVKATWCFDQRIYTASVQVPSIYRVEELFDVIVEALLGLIKNPNKEEFRSRLKKYYAIWYRKKVCMMTDLVQDLEVDSDDENSFIQVAIEIKPKTIEFVIPYEGGIYRGSFTENQMVEDVLTEFCNV